MHGAHSLKQADSTAAAQSPVEVQTGFSANSIYSNVEICVQPGQASELKQLTVDLAPKVSLKVPQVRTWGEISLKRLS